MSGDWRKGIEDAEIPRLARQWGLEAIRSNHLRSGPAVVHCIHTADRAFVLHIHRPGIERQELSGAQRCRTILADAGLPAVKPLADLNGSTIVEWRSHLVELQPWIDHDRVINYEWGDVAVLCSVMGRAHDVLAADDQLALTVHPRPDTVDLVGQLEQTRRCIGHGDEAHVTSSLLDARQVLDAVAQFERTTPTAAAEPIHGDMTGGNALMVGSSVAALIDFGMLALGPRMADLAAAIFWAFFVTSMDDVRELAWPSARQCCGAYLGATERRVTEKEARRLVVELARLPAAGVAVSHREDHASAEVAAFGRGLTLAQWLLDHLDDAVDLLVPQGTSGH